MKSTIILAALAASLTGAVANAEPKSPPPPATEMPAPTQAVSPDQRYCIDSETTGSRLRHRECHTAAQWKVLDVDVLAAAKR
ncbi:hypothetical protein [Sphingomonas sp. Mn802worker]|uniref:hypothetical protein n=1 Tax=Sphingomonas sp. Mn802worker TaxID=629773 RepID=UPI00036C60D8|nr:hypothetical protein [Sphingomonas sp. Mn802worker]